MNYYLDCFALRDVLERQGEEWESLEGADLYISPVTEAEFGVWLLGEAPERISSIKGKFESRFKVIDIHSDCTACSGWRIFFDDIFAKMIQYHLPNFREEIEFYFFERLLEKEEKEEIKFVSKFVSKEDRLILEANYRGFNSLSL